MGGIVGKFFYPFGITVAVAVLVSLFVSFTLDPMLSSDLAGPADATGCAELPVLGHLMRATDRVLDAAARRLRAADPLDLLGPPLPRAACRRSRPTAGRSTPPAGATRRAAPLALRDDHAARDRRARRHRQLRRRDRAGAAGRHRVHPGERQQLHPAERDACRSARACGAAATSCARSRTIVAQHARGPDGRRRPIGDTGSGLPQLGGADASSWSSRSERKRSQKRGRGGDPQGARSRSPASRSSLGNRPIYVALLGPDPTVLEAEVAASCRSKVAEGAAASPT